MPATGRDNIAAAIADVGHRAVSPLPSSRRSRRVGWSQPKLTPPHPYSTQTRWEIVPPGSPSARRCVTNFPDAALRFTARPLPVPLPTRSVVVLPGQRAAAALLTN